MHKFKSMWLVIPFIFLSLVPSANAQQASFLPLYNYSKHENPIHAADPAPSPEGQAERCPAALPEASTVSFPHSDDADRENIDKNKEVTDLGTSIVNDLFLNTPDALFDFLSLVYNNVNATLEKYRAEKNLDEKAIFLVFKGGNILRLIANRFFHLVPEDAANLLRDYYAEYFKRSDNDFSIYIDEKRLGSMQFDNVYDEVNDLVFQELNKIRDILIEDPNKYFGFAKLNTEESAEALKDYFSQLENLDAVKDPNNHAWFKAQFKQLQLLDKKAIVDLDCDFGGGQYDYKYEQKGQKIIGTPISDKPNWIVNSDNRTIDFPWGSDSDKGAKFSLLRSKVAFEYFVEQKGKLLRRVVPAELIDITIVHRDDSNVREFLDNYTKNVAEYSIHSDTKKETLKLLSYSLAYLASDIQIILFDTYDRPWNMGSKYSKRVNRLFFLSAIEMIGVYGFGSPKIGEYNKYVKDNLIAPMKKLYPLNKNSKNVANKLIREANKLSRKFKGAEQTNAFWLQLTDIIRSRLVATVEEGDEQGLIELLDLVSKNMEITDKLGAMEKTTVDIGEIYNANIDDIF